MENYVWYVGYGSNLSKCRFLCYIRGGIPPLGNKRERGCSDKTPPICGEPKTINYKLYFALPPKRKCTENWGPGGVAFILPDEDKRFITRCRMWKITENQYIEVRCQEGLGWYNKEITLGEKDGCPIKTITQCSPFTNNIVTPSDTYLKTIAEGLRETYKYNDDEISDYLLEKDGIKDKIKREYLLQIINNKRT